MDLRAELRTVATDQNLGEDFPDWLMREVLDLADSLEDCRSVAPLIESLIAQIKDYDPFAGAGCFDVSAGAETIQQTIRRIKVGS